MCSVFKLLAAAAVLPRVDQGQEDLDRLVPLGPGDLLDYAPIVRKHIGRGMSVSELCAAAVEYSDNTAGNLLVAALGGPDGLTRYLRSLGDNVTRLDRVEPDVNTAVPGDERDTTSPVAMVDDLHRLLLGDALSAESSGRLEAWLANSVTGRTRIRAGLPATWRVGDKTGLGEHGTTNDVAVLRPPDREPILVAAFITQTTASSAERDAALAAIGRLIGRSRGPRRPAAYRNERLPRASIRDHRANPHHVAARSEPSPAQRVAGALRQIITTKWGRSRGPEMTKIIHGERRRIRGCSCL